MQTERLLWWQRGVIYQIYPRSFFDASGDGVGDLQGIIAKLDYLEYLGISGVWLSPINLSPMYDFGYDISDYRRIDPLFGTEEDFNILLEEAHKREIKIILDLVINHTSHLHPWFIESRSSRSNPKRDWYIWKDGVKGKPPNNWQASFGGRAWEWDEKTESYYLHSFLPEQPDINWRNSHLKRAVFSDIRYWLDKGVDGFRLDVVNWFIKDDQFRNNPFGLGKYPRPYDLQKHIYDRNRPETHTLLRELRSLLNTYNNRMTVGEVFNEKPGNHALSASFLGNGRDELHLAFDFSLVFEKWSAKRFFNRISGIYKAMPEKGWPCFVLSNHDNPRSAARFGRGLRGERRNRVALTLLLSLRGTPFLYYGEELGMRDGRIRKEEIQDPVGKRYWPFNKGRDPERTPMQWDRGLNGGFSTGKPWLPVNKDYIQRNVELQTTEETSLLSYVKHLIDLRKRHKVLENGSWEPEARGRGGIISYYRINHRESVFVILNFSCWKKRYLLKKDLKVLESTHREKGIILKAGKIKLYPEEATLFLVNQEPVI